MATDRQWLHASLICIAIAEKPTYIKFAVIPCQAALTALVAWRTIPLGDFGIENVFEPA